jgi:hypothetical protein
LVKEKQMANPNIVNVTSIYGKTTLLSVTTVSSNVVVNELNSDKIFKINSLYVSNLSSVNVANVSVSFTRGANTNHLARFIDVPNKSTFTAIDKTTSIYLEEGDAIQASANSNNALQIICSYEEIS